MNELTSELITVMGLSPIRFVENIEVIKIENINGNIPKWVNL